MTNRSGFVLAGALLALASGSSPTDAARSPFSGVVERRVSQATAGASRVTFDTLESIFNVTVSLEGAPPGDDDATVDRTGDEAQRKYEEIFRQFADALCEESNGAHHLGEVRIFRNGQQSAHADIVWNASEWPRGNVGGFQTDGLHIIFGDSFPEGCGPGCNVDMLADPIGSGYTLAHEWGHFAFSLYDEYVGSGTGGGAGNPRSTDTPVVPSIMNRQWDAVGGNFDWLNHSTANNFHVNTAQGRVYGKSGWEVLVQPKYEDPLAGERTAQPGRYRFLSLEDAAPTAAEGWIKKELPGGRAGCRQDLKIVWVSNLEMQVVIDRSGSMVGPPLDNAKVAASALVSVVPDGQTALGVVEFDAGVDQLVPITAIPKPGAAVKAGIQSSIAGIFSGGASAIFDAASLALGNLKTYAGAQKTHAAQVVFLLSDGGDNSSTVIRSDVVAAYRTADVPLVTFAYGGSADFDLLRGLADDTGGFFFTSPTTLGEIESAFLLALASLGAQTTLVAAAPTAPPGGAATQPFIVDATLASFTVLVSYPGAPAAVTLSIAGPGGPLPSPFTCTAVGGQTSCIAQVDAPAAGGWTLRASNPGGTAVKVAVDVIATPKAGRTFELTVAPLGGSRIVYPAPIVVTAAVSQGRPITGVHLVATVTDPDGITTPIDMNDEGRAGDGVAGDGFYSAILGYQKNGVHTVTVQIDNDAGKAAFTDAAFQPTVAKDGSEPKAPPLPPITQNFTRAARAQLTVEGVRSDDHANAPPGTSFTAGKDQVAGRIDFAGDADWFTIQGIDRTKVLVVRVARLALGMEPELTVFLPDGTTAVATGTLATAASKNGYVVLSIPAASLDASGRMLARVRHVNAAAVGGTYEISAGAAIYGDGQPGVDQFRCYPAKGKARRQTIEVRDSFERKMTRVLRPTRVCAPVDRNGSGIELPDAWLTCFQISDAKTKPAQKRFRQAIVTFNDTFGAHKVRARAPSALCVPSGRGSLPGTAGLNPFKCYQARGKSARQTTVLTDVFGARRTRALQGLEFCDPAGLAGADARPDTPGLVCYAIKDAKTKPRQKPFKSQNVTMMSALGTHALRLKSPQHLCVPTTR